MMFFSNRFTKIYLESRFTLYEICISLVFFVTIILIRIRFTHPSEKLSGRLDGHPLALLFGLVVVFEPGVEAFLRYHIIVVQAIEDLFQQACK